MEGSVNPDQQTAPEAVWSECKLFYQTFVLTFTSRMILIYAVWLETNVLNCLIWMNLMSAAYPYETPKYIFCAKN